MNRNYTVTTTIARPVAEVFDAVVSKEKLAKYFVDDANGDIVEGAELRWRWNHYHATLPASVKKVDAQRYIELTLSSKAWEKTTIDDYPVATIFEFAALDDNNCTLAISEAGWKTDTEGLKGSHDNCGGWMHMAMCLKAWIEHGIHLR